MLYKEYQPNILLSPYIESYWVVEGFAGEGEFHRILPDGCVDIIFSFGDSSPQDGLTPFSPTVIGTMSTSSEGFYFKKVNMLGIRFKPACFTAFTRTPVDEFTNQRVNLSEIDTLFDMQIYSELQDELSTEGKIQHLNTYLIKKITHTFVPRQQIVYAVDLIRLTNGQLPLMEVASKSCLCLRHFEREFKKAVGISPKTFSKITKFNCAMSFLKKNINASLFSTAIECGYYDHAHLIKEFKTLSGGVPSQLGNLSKKTHGNNYLFSSYK